MTDQIWWAVARSEDIHKDKPVNADIGDQPVVLWRDANGAVRALEDRCPHRRAPLSLGCILGNGMIQCGYHGWTYDGETGHLKDIPNLKSTQKFPPVYKAKPFGVAESGGFVRVCLNPKAENPAPLSEKLPLSGRETVALDHQHYVDTLFDDPGLLINIRGVRFSPYLMAELSERDGRLVLERSCQWASPHWPAPFSSDFPITLKISADPASGESELLLRDDQFNPLLRATLAPVPGARGVTQVQWRAKLERKRPGLMAKAMGLRAPFNVLSHIDGESLRVLKPSASIHASDLREEIASRSDSAAQAAA
ncbi:Rieske 2Fe-2S domain-containing protein [Parasphingorhabdus sp.]|uniref:Rieske 2Fe-2S domain-containing protein n=1 Tax=Parasphingorhabdus sp. TaxID=2709688 RepID=UPI003BAE7EB6